MKRTQIRDQAFKLVFQEQFYGDEEIDEQMKLLLSEGSTVPDPDDIEEGEEAGEEFYMTKKASAQIAEKADGVMTHLSEIDEKLSSLSSGWKLSRMNKVDLAILRLAVYEIVYEELPPKIAINEAVELAKKYGSDQSGSFVNGVLAGLVNKDKPQ